VDRIQKVITAASEALEQEHARTAAKALKVLSDNMDQIRSVVVERKKRNEADAFTFTYEEDADPETFFVPYVWEVIVCCATSSSIEWDKSKIQVFPMVEEEPPTTADTGNNSTISQKSQPPARRGDFSEDLTDVA
jgi:hypothetical protein